MKDLGLLTIFSLCASLAGCATGPASLDASDVQHLASMPPVTVVYVDPITVLDGEPSGPSPQTLGKALGDISLTKKIQAKLEPYQAQVQQLGVADREYDAVHAALSAVPWLKDATWKRMKKQDSDVNDYNFQYATSQQAPGRVVIIIEAGLLMQSYVDQLDAGADVDIYTRKVANSPDRPLAFTSDRLDAPVDLGNPGPELGSNGRQLSDAELKARLDALFGGDSAPFLRDLDRALASLKTQLTDYFSGVGSQKGR